jgi:hypothetical protein
LEEIAQSAVQNDPPGDPNQASMFSDISFIRKANPPQTPWLDDLAARAVAISTILDALGPTNFEDFASHKVSYHSDSSTRGVLESQPHNLVHNEVGGLLTGPPDRQGFMRDFLSPVDPIFFMHHSNIDRLWDVWTRKQLLTGQQQGRPDKYPIAPTSADDLKAWKAEPFLFFIGPDGKPVAQQTAGDYLSTALFDYDYQPGSGEIVVPKTTAVVHGLAGQKFRATMLPQAAAASNQASAAVKVPGGLPAAAMQKDGVRLVARITVELPPDSRDVRLHVLVNVPPEARHVSFSDPSYAGTFEPFSGHRRTSANHESHSVTFSVGLTHSVAQLATAKRVAASEQMKVTVVGDWPGITLKAPEIKVTNITIAAQ